MNYIESFLTGVLDAKSFINELNCNKELQNQIRDLISIDDASNRNSMLWKRISFDALKSHDFDSMCLLNAICKYDNSISDNLNLHSTLREIYCYYNPEVICTHQYDKAFDIYLEAIQDCFDGPEVERVVERIIQDALTSSNAKTKQRVAAKFMVKEAFHILDRKRPRWIQGPEWPMGKESPMMFIEQKRLSEEVHYLFKDVTTDEMRTIIQWY